MVLRFRWAFCQLDTLRRSLPIDIRKALNKLPATLDETYERALEGIPTEKWQHAHRLFQCLVVAIRPLHVKELAELFAIHFDADTGPSNFKEDRRPQKAEDALLSVCSSLITVIKDKDLEVVQFSHVSVKEFLTSDRLRTSEVENIRRHYIPLDAAHTILAQASLTVLLQLKEDVDRERLKTFPLAIYAAQHWVDHARYKDVAPRIQDGIEHLFNPKSPYLPAWTWIHDLDSVDQARETTHALEERPKPPAASALYYAVLCGFSWLAGSLITAHGENVNANCGNYGTPLHAASYRGHLDAVHLLLDHGANVHMTNKRKRTPLCSAYDGGHLEVVRVLLIRGANADVQYDEAGNLLHDASFNGRTDVVGLLLQHKADVNSRNGSNDTPLHQASIGGQTRVAELLLDNGADVNAQNGSHRTPLYRASEKGHLQVVQVLLRHGADVHIRTDKGRTPLHAAALLGHVEVVQLLLDHDAGQE